MFKIEEIKCELLKSIEGEIHDRYVKFIDNNNPRNFCILPENMKNVITKMKSMEIYEDDIWILTHPKSGTTWTQEMVCLMVNNLNFEVAINVQLSDRTPFIEYEGFFRPGSPTVISFQAVLNLKRPRIIKSHLPAFLLPDDLIKGKAKIIYVARNPKDVAVSYFHHHVHLEGWKVANLEIFIEAFVEAKVHFSPFNDHVLKFWEMRKCENFLFLHFEDMKRDLKAVVSEVSKFLGKSYSSNELENLCIHLSFENMRNNKMVNNSKPVEISTNLPELRGLDFNTMRKGKVGSYNEELTLEQNNLLDVYARQIEGTDFKYKFD